MNDLMTDAPIQVQGRIYSDSRTYVSCKSAPSKKVFKTLLGLAEEALSVREAVAKWSAGHPFGPKLSGMQSAEVVVFLMGITQQFSQEQGKSGDKPLDASSDKVRPANQQVEKPQTKEGSQERHDKGSRVLPVLDMDDDLLESFSTFPSK